MLLRREVQPITGLRQAIGKEAEVFGGADRGLGHEAVGLTGIPALQHGDVFGMRLNSIGDLVEKRAALLRRPSRPWLEGGLGGGSGTVDIIGGTARHMRDHRFVDRGAGLECSGRIDPLAGNDLADAVRFQPCEQRLDAGLVVRQSWFLGLGHHRAPLRTAAAVT
jgi:hypothetical protein